MIVHMSVTTHNIQDCSSTDDVQICTMTLTVPYYFTPFCFARTTNFVRTTLLPFRMSAPTWTVAHSEFLLDQFHTLCSHEWCDRARVGKIEKVRSGKTVTRHRRLSNDCVFLTEWHRYRLTTAVGPTNRPEGRR